MIKGTYYYRDTFYYRYYLNNYYCTRAREKYVLRQAAAPPAMHMKTSMTLIKIKINKYIIAIMRMEKEKKTSKIRVKSPNVCPTWIKDRKNAR